MKAMQDSNTVAAAQAAGHDDTLDHALDRLNTAQQQFAAVRAIYGENYSEYRKAKEQVDELQKHVKELTTNANDRAAVEYHQALGNEQRLELMVHSAKNEVDGLSARALQYEQMKSDAENDKKLYEDLERRTAEASINNQVSGRHHPGRCARSARRQKGVSQPSIESPIALVLSAYSVSSGWCWRTRSTSRCPIPEDVAKRLDVQVLGVIPATRNLMNPVAGTCRR